MRRTFWQKLFWWRYLLFQRHRHNNLVLEKVAGYPILVLPEVLNPRLFRTGEFLAESLNERLIPAQATVLDMGTGTGIGAIAAARWAERVVAVDINPAAVRCAQINVLLNRVEDRVMVCEGDLFAPVPGRQFDLILFNPPYFRGEPQDMLDRAFHANDVAERFAAGLPTHLTAAGHLLLLLASQGEEQHFLQIFKEAGWFIDVIARRDMRHEVVTVYCVKRKT